MTEKLCFLGCRNFHREIALAVEAEGWGDVAVAAFPARCGRPAIDWDELGSLLPEDCAEAVVLGRACIGELGTPPAGFPPLRIESHEQCFHLVAGRHLVDETIRGGGYLMTPSWLANWRGQLRALGFSADQAGDFFRDFARELVLLDTGTEADAPIRLEEFGDAVGLPVRRLAIGLDHVRLLLRGLVLQWRLDAERRAAEKAETRHAGELANHVAAMDMVSRLAKAPHEDGVIAVIEELFCMLFAPGAFHYVRVENGIPVPGPSTQPSIRDALLAMTEDYAWTPDGRGFLLRIGGADAVVGLLAVDRLAFPEHRERYLNMALSVSGICALAIDNARNRRKLIEAEKMASLSIVVAGVAHEIGTPLGVGLVAASTLAEQTEAVAGHFARRSMTQSELEAYLRLAGESTSLIHGNLERIGRLIAAFREVAVDAKVMDIRRFPLRACIDEALAGLGAHMPTDRVRMCIVCDPALELESSPSDWASIFINLVANSIKHGFKGREVGAIEIEVGASERKLRIDYRDDGNGMAADIRAKIFDPFFTTDLQRGTGLGLNLVYNLVTRRFGGLIQCESEPGQGVHFRIEVPR